MIEQLSGLRTHLLSLGMKLGAVPEGKSRGEIADVINGEIEDRLAELSAYAPKLFSTTTTAAPTDDPEGKKGTKNGKRGTQKVDTKESAIGGTSGNLP